jgi:hypothetical protein
MKLNMPFESSLVMFLVLTYCKLSYIKVDLGEIGWGGVDWIGLVQDGNRWCNETLGSIKCWDTIEWLYTWWPLK